MDTPLTDQAIQVVVQLAERAEPGSTLILRTPIDLELDIVEAITAQITTVIPDIQVVVLAGGLEVAAICPHPEHHIPTSETADDTPHGMRTDAPHTDPRHPAPITDEQAAQAAAAQKATAPPPLWGGRHGAPRGGKR